MQKEPFVKIRGKPDFVGCWGLESNLESMGLFLMYIHKKEHAVINEKDYMLIEGGIEDIIGSANFSGRVNDEEIYFQKDYVSAVKKEEVKHIFFVYDGKALKLSKEIKFIKEYPYKEKPLDILIDDFKFDFNKSVREYADKTCLIPTYLLKGKVIASQSSFCSSPIIYNGKKTGDFYTGEYEFLNEKRTKGKFKLQRF